MAWNLRDPKSGVSVLHVVSAGPLWSKMAPSLVCLAPGAEGLLHCFFASPLFHLTSLSFFTAYWSLGNWMSYMAASVPQNKWFKRSR